VGTVRHAGRFGGHLAVGKHQQGALGLLKNFTGEGEELATNKVIEYAGGDSYEGQVLRGLKHGQGTYTWANGASYTGEWANNVPCGDGSYSWLDGESYKGAFKFGRRHGSGAYTWTSGASFVGVFRDDVPVGKGICTLPGGRCFHGEYALFAAYLRASEMQRGRKQADVWVAAKWAQSSDLLRNPPWLGFTAVRPGRRHYDKAVSGSGAQALAAAPVVTPKVLSIGWPKAPFEQTEGLDLAHGPSMHMAPRQVGFEWPRVGPPPSRKVEDDVEEEARDDYHIWHVGDVCECLDMVGAPLRSIGMAELPGRLTPQQPHGLYFKVRLEAVEFVWPGFTETTFPLVICKVVYVGIDPSVKPSEWVPASRLRTAMAAPNFGNPLWKGWQVSNSACGEYVKDAFVTTEVVEVNETVECLLPFSGQDRQGDQAALPALPPPPRLLEVASAQMAHEMLLVADPDADGMWVLATPAMLVTLPQLLVKLGLWDLLFKRVWGSLPFMALMVLEHGPDLLCSHMDMTRAALAAEEAEEDLLQDHPDYVASANSWAWVGTKVDGDKVMAQMLAAQDDADNAHDAQLSTRLTPKQVFSLHHEFAHMHKEALRRRALIEVATEANLPAVDALNHLVSGEAGLVAKMSYAMEKATSLDEPSPAIRSLLLMTLRKLRHLKLLGLVPTLTEYIERQENKVSAFLADQAMQSGSRSSVFDDLLQVVSSPGGKRTRKALEAIDAYALEFQANAPHQEEQAVLRLELDATFSCEHSGQVVSRVLLFLKEFPAMRGATLSILRVEAGSTPETNRDMSRTVLHVAVSALPQLRVACAEVVEAFYNEADAEAFGSIWSFASIARERYRLVRVDLLNPSVFLSLTFLRSSSPLQGIKSSEASLLQRALLWRSLLLRILPHLNDQVGPPKQLLPSRGAPLACRHAQHEAGAHRRAVLADAAVACCRMLSHAVACCVARRLERGHGRTWLLVSGAWLLGCLWPLLLSLTCRLLTLSCISSLSLRVICWCVC